MFALQLSDVPKSQNIKCFCCCDFKWVVHRHRISFIFLCNRVFNPDFSICIVLFDPFYCGNYCHVNIKIILLPSEVMLRPCAEAVLLLLMPPVSGVSLSTLAELLSNICWPEALEWEERWTDDWALNTSVLSRPRPSLYFTSHQSWTQERLRQWWFVFVLCPKL